MKRKEMTLLITVYPPEDIFIEGMLNQAGIQVFKTREAISPVEGIYIGPLAEIKLFVPQEQAEEARMLLDSIQKGTGNENLEERRDIDVDDR
ncbi:MAG: DUF2007 domain-containing protein [Syntrophomonadaceae bacterium]|nr:DUF2007 domain-containing protein [Syntrophomonadaceae bacterium]